jgi:hypothetical protein
MALTNDSIVWTGKTVGLTLENYNGKLSIKSCRKYQKGGEDVLTYDWIYVEEYDKETKKRKMAEKPRPASIYLGDHDQAIKALQFLLRQLGGSVPRQESDPGEVPF